MSQHHSYSDEQKLDQRDGKIAFIIFAVGWISIAIAALLGG